MITSLYPVFVQTLQYKKINSLYPTFVQTLQRTTNNSLYPIFIQTLAYKRINALYPVFVQTLPGKKINGLYPVFVQTLPSNKKNSNMWNSLYPIFIQTLPFKNNNVSFIVPPDLEDLQLINDGKEAFASAHGNLFLISYSSHINPADIIGNISINGHNWNPVENNTDPPSHFVLVNKDLTYDCTFFPVFDSFNGIFSMAWIENNAVGRLNLKYSESPNKKPGQTVLHMNNDISIKLSDTSVPDINQTIYIKPYVKNTDDYEKLENIPMSDILVIDTNDNVFNLNAFMGKGLPFGYEMNLPKQIKAIRFSQVFREHFKLDCMIGTAPQGSTINTDYIPSIGIAGIQVNVYRGKTYNVPAGMEAYGATQLDRSSDFLYKTYFSDKAGKFTIDAIPGRFTLEIIVNTPSINFSQRIM